MGTLWEREQVMKTTCQAEDQRADRSRTEDIVEVAVGEGRKDEIAHHLQHVEFIYLEDGLCGNSQSG